MIVTITRLLFCLWTNPLWRWCYSLGKFNCRAWCVVLSAVHKVFGWPKFTQPSEWTNFPQSIFRPLQLFLNCRISTGPKQKLMPHNIIAHKTINIHAKPRFFLAKSACASPFNVLSRPGSPQDDLFDHGLVFGHIECIIIMCMRFLVKRFELSHSMAIAL